MDKKNESLNKYKQSQTSVDKNTTFFRDNIQTYNEKVQNLDTYVTMHGALNQALQDIHHLLDIGSGGVFDYDTNLIKEIVALDLFMEDVDVRRLPDNVTPITGSALDLKEPDNKYDGILMAMLIHHLVGENAKESLANVEQAIKEAVRVLQPGGKFVILESCVPTWFYNFERIVFRPAAWVIKRIISHPPTLQYPANKLTAILKGYNADVQVVKIQKGRWVIQFGFKFPAFLTPVQPYCFVLRKPLTRLGTINSNEA